jgi:GGDEF domain-containing protein
MRNAEQNNWTYIDLKINQLDAFKEVYGFVAGNEVQRFTALMLGEVVDELGTPNDFVGHPGGDNFVVITHSEQPEQFKQAIASRFEEGVKQHYSFIDRERGYMIVQDASGAERQVPLMTISSGSVSARTRTFADIREITELAAEDRRTGSAAVEEYETTEW